MSDRIMALHPDPTKQGVNIDRAKYEVVKAAILDILAIRGEVAFADLPTEVHARLGETFDGSVSWYVTTVKLDLEARGLIERSKQGGRQVVRLRD